MTMILCLVIADPVNWLKLMADPLSAACLAGIVDTGFCDSIRVGDVSMIELWVSWSGIIVLGALGSLLGAAIWGACARAIRSRK